MDKDWAMYRTKHFGQTHFKQGQGQDIKGQGHDIKQFGVDRGQREMAKIEDMEVDNSHNNGTWPDRRFIGKAVGH